MATAWLRMEDVYILCNMIKTFWRRKVIEIERWKPFGLSMLQMTLAQSYKNTLAYLCKKSNTSIAKKRNWLVGYQLWLLNSFGLNRIKGIKSLSCTKSKNKSTCVGLIMTMLAKMWKSSLGSTMLIHQRKELNILKKSECRCFHPMWKLTFHVMVAKVLLIASWVFVCSLLWECNIKDEYP